MTSLGNFIGLYPVSKTLRFELRPTDKTLQWIKNVQGMETSLLTD